MFQKNSDWSCKDNLSIRVYFLFFMGLDKEKECVIVYIIIIQTFLYINKHNEALY